MRMTEPFQEFQLSTARGALTCRHYIRPGARSGIIWLGGVGGFWDGPARDLYPRLCEDLVFYGLTSLRVRFRHPTNVNESVADALSAMQFLRDADVHEMGLVGHSFGGAVAIQAGTFSATVPKTVVALAPQSQGAEGVGRLPEDCSILLIHGKADEVLHFSNSEYLHALAHPPKRLLLYEHARHSLDEAAPDVHRSVREWLIRHLAGREHWTHAV